MISNNMSFFLIFLSALLVNNILLIRFIALCSFFGISSSIKASIGMGFAVIFVMVMSSAVSWLVYHLILMPLHLEFLRTAAFILTIATFVQFVEMFIRRVFPPLYRALGIYLPLIVVNCAVLAAAFLAIDYNLNFLQSAGCEPGLHGGDCPVCRHAGNHRPRPHLQVVQGYADRLHLREPHVARLSRL
jgi:electron transport complex protein RnfA